MEFSANICELETSIQFGTHSALAPFTILLAGIDGILIIVASLFLLHHRTHPKIVSSSLELCLALLFGAAIGVVQMTLVGIPIQLKPRLCQIRILLGSLSWCLILLAGALKAIRILRMKSIRHAYCTSSTAITSQFCLSGIILVNTDFIINYLIYIYYYHFCGKKSFRWNHIYIFATMRVKEQ